MDAIYVRQSVDKKDSLSIEGQIELCLKYAGDDARIFQDKGYSGKNIKRPGFTALMNAVEAGQVHKIFVYRLDRFSRSIADFSRLWETLEHNGVEFQSVTEHFDTSTPIGRAMLNIVLVFAQLERETISERVKDNYIHRFRLGAWPGGPAPYGFDLTRITCDGKKVSSLTTNEQAEVVKWIFEEYSKTETSLRSIAKMLMEKGIHGPKREAWDNVTISRILHSPLYVKADEDVYWYYVAKGLQIQQDIGVFDGVHACNVIGKRDRTKNKYNSLENQLLTVSNHEGFIDSSLWIAVQEKLEKNPQISRANAGKYSWLTGIMKCQKCGYAIKINHNKNDGKFYLLCSGRSNFSTCDASVQVDLRELEKEVEKQIDDVLKASPAGTFISNNNNLSEEILATEQKIERLVNALSESSEVSAIYISKQIDALHKQREELIGATSREKQQEYRLDFKKLDFDRKKVVAAEFIDKILLDKNEVNILWKF